MIKISLSNLRDFIRRFWFFGLFGLLLIFVIIAFFARLEKEEKPKILLIDKPKFEKAGNLIQEPRLISVTSQIQPPQELNVFQIPLLPPLQSEVIRLSSSLQIKGALQIGKDPQEGEIFSVEDEKAILSVSNYRINYKKTSPKEKKVGFSFSNLEASLKVKAFLESLNLWDERYRVDLEKTEFLRVSATELAQEKDPQKAHFMELNHLASIDGYQLAGLDPKIPFLEARINPDGEIFSFSLVKLPQFQKINSYSLKSFVQATKEVEAKRGTAVRMLEEGKSLLGVRLYRASSFTLDKAYLAYYLPTRPITFAQPIYVFQGRFLSTVGETGEVVIYLPAIDEKYFKR